MSADRLSDAAVEMLLASGEPPTAPPEHACDETDHARITDPFAGMILRAKLDQEFIPSLILTARSLLLFLKNGVRLGELVAEFQRYGFDLKGQFPAAMVCERKQLVAAARQMVAVGWIDAGDELLKGIDLDAQT